MIYYYRSIRHTEVDVYQIPTPDEVAAGGEAAQEIVPQRFIERHDETHYPMCRPCGQHISAPVLPPRHAAAPPDLEQVGRMVGARLPVDAREEVKSAFVLNTMIALAGVGVVGTLATLPIYGPWTLAGAALYGACWGVSQYKNTIEALRQDRLLAMMDRLGRVFADDPDCEDQETWVEVSQLINEAEHAGGVVGVRFAEFVEAMNSLRRTR